MKPISTQDILFDDFALLEQHIGRQQLIATSVNANCDCASSPPLYADTDRRGYASLTSDCDLIGHPSTSHYDDRNPD